MKVCSRCGKSKDKTFFWKDKRRKIGVRSTCIECCKKQRKTEEEIKYRKKYFDAYRKTDKFKKWYEGYHKTKKYKDWFINYHGGRKKERNKYLRNKTKNDPVFKLRCLLRARFSSAVKYNSKKGSAVRDLGCSIEELKLHIEKQFKPGMTWENHGDWHIDHIRPLVSFDLTDRDQFLEACNFSNLQPLWASDNLRKNASWKY